MSEISANASLKQMAYLLSELLASVFVFSGRLWQLSLDPVKGELVSPSPSPQCCSQSDILCPELESEVAMFNIKIQVV